MAALCKLRFLLSSNHSVITETCQQCSRSFYVQGDIDHTRSNLHIGMDTSALQEHVVSPA